MFFTKYNFYVSQVYILIMFVVHAHNGKLCNMFFNFVYIYIFSIYLSNIIRILYNKTSVSCIVVLGKRNITIINKTI